MLNRVLRIGGLGLLFLPVPLRAQGVTIDHDAVGCVVVDQYPKVTACFSPANNLARGRLYFRAEEGPPTWYYVEMKSDAPCHAGVLPKPKKELIGKKVLYYLSAFDRNFVENRTVDHTVLVVKAKSECTKGVPLAPSLASASVAVFPGVPAGFAAAGIGAATTVAAVAGGAAVVGGGVALAVGKSSNNSSPPTTAVAAVTSTLPVTTTTTTTTTTTLPLAPFSPVFNVFVDGSLIPADQTQFVQVLQCGLAVEFDMCPSTGPYPLSFNVDLSSPSGSGPAGTMGGLCDFKGTMDGGGFRLASTGRVAPAFIFADVWNVTMRMQSAAPANKPQAARALTFVFDRTGPFCRFSESEPSAASPPRRRLTWASQLEVPGGSGQVVINGATAVFAGGGRSTVATEGRVGENRVEAQLVRASGAPGTWTFELGPGSARTGSVRVVAGTVALITDDRVVFRLAGRAGERVVFTFRAESN